MQATIECPSGLNGTVSYLRTEDAKCLADPRLIREGKAADAIITACWKRTEDPGPYALDGAGKLDWGHVLACDRIYAIMMIRVATHGASEELDMKCSQCRKKFVWDVPLDELQVHPVPEASREKIKARDNDFPGTLRDGTAFRFRLATGHDQVGAKKLMQEAGSDVMTAMLQKRVLGVEGVDPKEEALHAWCADASLGETQHIIDQFDEADGFIDTVFDVYCPRCGFEWEIDLPLDLQRMFAPKRRIRRRRRGIVVANREPDESDAQGG